MPICILGMHRSGTSPITRLLNLCGMYLGPDEQIMPPSPEDNPEGYWENQLIVNFNDELLASLDGSWDQPPGMSPGWCQDARYEVFRHRAKGLLAELAAAERWGWKDPRNSLTLEFWLSVFPNLKMVLCLRNPLEVASSLSTGKPMRTLTFEQALDLWVAYHERIVTVVNPEQLIVAHYDAYFYDTETELRRVVGLLGMDPKEEQIAAACATIKPSQRRNMIPATLVQHGTVPASVVEHYKALCLEAGPVYERMQQDACYQLAIAQDAVVRLYPHARQVAALQREVSESEALRELMAIKDESLATAAEAYRAMQEALGQRDEEIEALHAMVAAKDEALATAAEAYQALEESVRSKDDELLAGTDAYQALEATVADYDGEIGRIQCEMDGLAEQYGALAQELAEHKEYGRSLEIERGEKEWRLQALTNEYAAITNSLAFRLTTRNLWRLQAKLAPFGSKRAIVLRGGKRVLKLALRRARRPRVAQAGAAAALAASGDPSPPGAARPAYRVPLALTPADQRDVVVCTIISKNYLAYARTLMQSVAEHHPDVHRVTLLVDEVAGHFDPVTEPFETIEAAALGIPNWRHFALKYSIMELNTAVKPYLLEFLFERYGARKVIYFDPDIVLYSRLDELLALLDEHGVVLTPHLAEPLGEDGKRYNEPDILRSGTFNLGFCAFARSHAWRELLCWWQEKLYAGCVVDPDAGIFVDQKWMDFAPSMFAGVHILRDPGYNVAYWNIKNRDLQKSAAGHCEVNGRRLVFFHFSGYSVEKPDQVSKHQNRYVMDDLNATYREVFSDYRSRMLANGHDEVKAWPYAYGFFSDGVPVGDPARRCLLRTDPLAQRWSDPFDVAGPGSFRHWLTRPSPELPSRYLSPYVMALHAMRPDLQAVFPYPLAQGEEGLARWFVSKEQDAEGQPDTFHRVYLEPVKAALLGNGAPSSAAGPADPMLPAVLTASDTSTGSLRATTSQAVTAAVHAASLTRGINIIGYVHSETGVGQQARNMIEALRAVHVSVAALPVEVYDFARKQDRAVTTHIPQGTPHRVNVFHVNADMTFPVREVLDPATYQDHYNVGYWSWELETFPDRWDSAFAVYDELWVPSTFIQSAVQARTSKPVLAIPPAIEPAMPAALSRADLGLPEDSFIVLFMFDAASIVERKNPWAAVRAFELAFSRSERRREARLVIKVNNLDKHPREAVRLRAEMLRVNGILINSYLDREQANALLNACDVYLSLHRAEGYGLTLAEAMYYGKPVVGTAYSGTLDFMTPRNSYLVPHRLITLDRDYAPYDAGNVWADPDAEAAAAMLRQIYEHRDEAAERGRRAAEDMRATQSRLVVGKRMQGELERIMAGVAATREQAPVGVGVGMGVSVGANGGNGGKWNGAGAAAVYGRSRSGG